MRKALLPGLDRRVCRVKPSMSMVIWGSAKTQHLFWSCWENLYIHAFTTRWLFPLPFRNHSFLGLLSTDSESSPYLQGHSRGISHFPSKPFMAPLPTHLQTSGQAILFLFIQMDKVIEYCSIIILRHWWLSTHLPTPPPSHALERRPCPPAPERDHNRSKPLVQSHALCQQLV